MFKTIVSRVKGSVIKKNRVNYLSGLWINFELSSSPKTIISLKMNGQYVTSNQLPTMNIQGQCVYDLHLPVVAVAKAIQLDKYIKIIIEDESGKEHVSYSCSVDNVYKKEFEYIDKDINTTLSYLPLINKQSINLLTDEKKLIILKNLFDANLAKDAHDTVQLIFANLNDYDSIVGKEIVSQIITNKEWIAILLNHSQFDEQHSYIPMAKQALCQLQYLDSKTIIENAKISNSLKQVLLDECVCKESNKFDFIQNFPIDDKDGVSQWNKLTSEQKKEYWPLLACGFEHKRQFERIKNYSPNYAWFTNVDENDKNAQIKSIIQSEGTRWFGISLLVNEFENNVRTAELIPYLQEFIWANWKQDFVNIDSFCYVLAGLAKRNLSHIEYKSLSEILLELFNSRVHNNINDVYRKSLIECITCYLNIGIKQVNWAFSALAQVVRPYYAFDDHFVENLEYELIKQFDQTYHQFAVDIYSKIKLIKSFFSTLQHDTPPNTRELRTQFNYLMFLHENKIQVVDKWILALSRYCQLHCVDELYFELSQIHEKIGDYYGALGLSRDKNEQQRLESLITQSGKGAKRKDAYWFELSLEARLEGGKARLNYIHQLYQFLINTKFGNVQGNDDLVHLLSSEIIHYLMQGEAFADVEELLPLINDAYVAGHTAIQVTNWIINADINRFSYKTLEEQCGEYGELNWLIEEFGHSIDNILNQQTLTALLIGIKQHYVYPYIQVMVYSCNAYENTRHKVIRESWLPKLKALDIDYCFVVGDAAQSHMDDDVMRLKVLDTYEELPHKSIEMFRFAYTNSHHRYYYKLDDDCVLNINAVFGDPAFLNQAYFGRAVKRPIGGVDRSWHHQKSRTQEAKTALDLSPEFSEYCDGSTGYILSNWAAEQLTIQTQDQNNKQLVSCSYFEDKLVGDLLKKAGVNYSDSGYNCVIRRKAAAGRDLQMWDYGLLPTSSNNIKVLHTEDDDFRLKMGKIIDQEYNNKPALIYRDAASTLNPEWISEQEQAPVLEKLHVDEVQIVQAKHLAIIVGKNEQELLPNLLNYHRRIGIDHFIFVDNCSEDNSLDYMLEQRDVSVFVATQEYKHSRFAVNWQETLLSHYGLGRWVLMIDSDELYTFPGSETKSIAKLTASADSKHANAFFTPMIDFYPKSELRHADVTEDKPFYEVCDHYDSLASMDKEVEPYFGPFSNSPSWHGGLRKRIFGNYNPYPQPNYVNQKFNLIKYQPNMRLIEGLHFMYGQRVSEQPTAIMHFKYHAGFHSKVIREIESGQHWNGATEYKRYAQHLESNKGCVLFDDVVSCKYQTSSQLFN